MTFDLGTGFLIPSCGSEQGRVTSPHRHRNQAGPSTQTDPPRRWGVLPLGLLWGPCLPACILVRVSSGLLIKLDPGRAHSLFKNGQNLHSDGTQCSVLTRQETLLDAKCIELEAPHAGKISLEGSRTLPKCLHLRIHFNSLGPSKVSAWWGTAVRGLRAQPDLTLTHPWATVPTELQ